MIEALGRNARLPGVCRGPRERTFAWPSRRAHDGVRGCARPNHGLPGRFHDLRASSRQRSPTTLRRFSGIALRIPPLLAMRLQKGAGEIQ